MQTSHVDPTRSMYTDILKYADLPWFDKLRRVRELIGNEIEATAWFEATALRLVAESMQQERLIEAARYLERLAREAYARKQEHAR